MNFLFLFVSAIQIIPIYIYYRVNMQNGLVFLAYLDLAGLAVVSFLVAKMAVLQWQIYREQKAHDKFMASLELREKTGRWR